MINRTKNSYHSIVKVSLFFIIVTLFFLQIGYSNKSINSKLASGLNLTLIRGQIDETKANGMPWDPFGGAPDPFVQINAGNIYISTVIKDSFFPEWNETFELPSNTYTIHITVKDEDLNFHDTIGSGAVNLNKSDIEVRVGLCKLWFRIE